jgi:hypothetical protein
MSNDGKSNVVPLLSPWRTTLLDALVRVQQSLFMVSPYIKAEVVSAMRLALLTRESEQTIEVRIITRVEPDELLSGASDIQALQQLLAWPGKVPGCAVEMRAIPNVHAKVWVCDTDVAFVGSGNATPSGLDDNLEYGLAVSDTQLVDRILSDWQNWWDKAERVETETLEEIARELQQIKQGDALHQSQAQDKVVRQALSQLPRVGRHIAPGTIPSVISEPAGQYPSSESPADLPTSGTSTREVSTFTVFALQFWRALQWVFPGFHKEHTYHKTSSEYQHGAFLKLSWKPHSDEHSTLRCSWADGQRLSQATILADNQAGTQSAWTIALNLDQLSRLGGFFAELDRIGLLDERLATILCISLHLSPTRLHLEYAGSAAEINHNAAISVLCIQAAMPASFPTLRPPQSHITVEHRDLLHAVRSLKREWYEMHATEQPLAVVEMCLTTPDPSSALTLSTGQIESPVTRTVPGKDCTIVGSEARMRLDFAALQQTITGTDDKVKYWQLSIDGYAEAIQLIPEPSMLNDERLFWGHQLWSL